MNKQEALEKLLDVCRKLEEPNGSPREPKAAVVNELASLVQDLEVLIRSQDTARRRAQWPRVAAALAGRALYLLVDEWEPVVGKELDAWLAEQTAGKTGGVVVVTDPAGPASYQPIAINGAVAREAYSLGLRHGGGPGYRYGGLQDA